MPRATTFTMMVSDEQHDAEADQGRLGAVPPASPNWLAITAAMASPGQEDVRA